MGLPLIEIREALHASPEFSLVFRPDELRNRKLFNEKILFTYSLANNTIDTKSHLTLIVGKIRSPNSHDPKRNLIRIKDVLVEHTQVFSLDRDQNPDPSTPGVYATWHGKKYFLGLIIERALTKHFSVFLVDSTHMEIIHDPLIGRPSKPIPLVTPHGDNLGTLPLEELLKKIDSLKGKQPSRMVLAFLGKTAPQIARMEGVTPQTIRYSVQESLARMKDLSI